jgi:16S rRNA (cytosine967-C5)-methyltransferase
VHNWEARGVPEASDARVADLQSQAEVVLVDAPCSGLGALRRNPDARWRLDEAEVATFPPRQLQILERYSRLVKPGGRLVYATCSINRAENQDVRAAFLAAHGREFAPVAALPPELDLPGDEVQLLPHRHGTDGFYLAAFRRQSTIVS